jgi:hypothetical protein
MRNWAQVEAYFVMPAYFTNYWVCWNLSFDHVHPSIHPSIHPSLPPSQPWGGSGQVQLSSKDQWFFFSNRKLISYRRWIFFAGKNTFYTCFLKKILPKNSAWKERISSRNNNNNNKLLNKIISISLLRIVMVFCQGNNTWVFGSLIIIISI